MHNQADTPFVITVNGPDEISCRLYPLATLLKEVLPEIRICVALLPSAGSAGREIEVVEALPCVDAVASVRETTNLILHNRFPDGFSRFGGGVLLHLGGDPRLSWLMAKRFRQPCLAYVDRPFALQSRFEKVFYSGSESVPEEEGNDGPDVIGDLTVDAVRLLCPKREPYRGGKITVGLYPGHRDSVARQMVPFFGAVADRVCESMPGIEWMLAKSEYLPAGFLKHMPEVEDGRPLEGDTLCWTEADGKAVLLTKEENRIEVVSPGVVAARANIALSVPGSSTGELAALGVPMVVTSPGCLDEVTPVEGLAGHAGQLPVVGKYVNRGAAHYTSKKNGYHSQPNRRSKRMVVPEVIGAVMARQVADVMIATLTSNMSATEEELKASMGPPGAARRLVDALRPYSEAPEPLAVGVS